MAIDIKKVLKELEESGHDFEVSSSSADTISMLDAIEFVNSHKDLIPWKSLVNNHWLQNTDDISTLISIISTQMMSKGSSNALYRKHDNASSLLVNLWVKKVESIAAERISQRDYINLDAPPIDREYLESIVSLSPDPGIITSLPDILAEQNIILIYEKALPGIKTDGIVFTLSNGIPVIGLTLRYPRLDYLWFTLLHELSHIVLHYTRLKSGIIEDLDTPPTEVFEIEANNLARYTIVPRHLWGRSPPWVNPTPESVIQFAQKLNRHPALIAGMVQFDLNKWQLFRDIVDSIDTREIIFGD